MSVRVVRTRNGEDVICDIREISQEGEKKILGYQLIKPYTVWISEGIDAEDDDGNIHKLSNPEITMEPYAHDDVVTKYTELVGATNGIESEDPVNDKQE